MNSDTGGLDANRSRQAAAEIARRKVLAAYERRNRAAAEAAQARSTASAAADNTTNTGATHMKDAPMEADSASASWRQYHSAWQNYYQKYYSEYYANAAQQYIAKERLKEAREQAEEEDYVSAFARATEEKTEKSGLELADQSAAISPDENLSTRTLLRRNIRKKASDSARRTRKFRKFIPLALGLAVTLTILFLQYNRLIFAPIMAYVSPGNAPATQIEAIDPTITQTVSSEPRLIIPKLNIDVPISFGVPLDDVMDAMNHGVAHYRISGASAYPGQVGNFIITGHSAGDVYSSNPYKYIFSGLERLDDGDLIYVNYESVRYTYRVIKKEVIEPTNVAALIVQTDKPLLTLVTCTPLGTSRYRLLVTAEQISPSTETGETTTPEPVEIPESTDTALPANEPSFFEGIWNFVTGN